MKKISVIVFHVVCLSYSRDAAITQNVLNLFFKIVIVQSHLVLISKGIFQGSDIHLRFDLKCL